MVLFVTVSVPPPSHKMPPAFESAPLPLMVLFVTVSVPKLAMPPPLPQASQCNLGIALLPLMVLSVTVAVPAPKLMPPPNWPAELLRMTLFITIRIPTVLMPPPLAPGGVPPALLLRMLLSLSVSPFIRRTDRSKIDYAYNRIYE
jgi:hypothetical protein